jgi:hypothetical protein
MIDDGKWQWMKNANWHDPKFSQKHNHPIVGFLGMM